MPSADRNGRLWPVDVLRGLAVVGMIETHVYNVGADPSLLANPLAPLLDALNGLVAPLFFVLTGFILQLKPASTAGRLGRRVCGAAGWWALAMLLHLPVIDAGGGGVDFSPWLQFDVLNALAASAFGLTLVQWSAGVEQRPQRLGGAAVAVLVMTALTDHLHLAYALTPWLRGWVAHGAYSRFPLLPWSAFVFFGAWLAGLREKLGLGEPALWPAWFVCTAVGAIALALSHSPPGRNLTHDGRANPLFTISRASLIALLLYVFLAWQRKAPNAPLRALAWLGRCSLGLYAMHLSLFFSVAMPGGSWATRVASRMSILEVVAFAAGLLVLSAALYRMWACAVAWILPKIRLAKVELRLL